jgi:hypothetical protein
MAHLVDEALVEARFGTLEIVLILMQDWSIVCSECTIDSEINLEAPNATPR